MFPLPLHEGERPHIRTPAGGNLMATPYATIGQPVGRAEGPEKVTGTTVYPADINLPKTLIGKCLRSPYAYARILSIDASAARRVPGVHTVLTNFDIPEMLVGR